MSNVQLVTTHRTKYRNLSDTLTRLGEVNPKIRNVVVMKLGCVLVAEADPPDGQLPITGREVIEVSKPERPRMGQASREILEALKKHPNVFDVDTPSSWDHMSLRGGPFGAIAEGPIFMLRVHLPKAQHRYQYMECIEHFSVISSGSIFGSFTPVDDCPSYVNIGHEFRELAKTQIGKCTPWKSPTIGPCPIHPDVYFIFLEPNGGLQGESRVYQDRGNILIVTEGDNARESRVVVETFFDLKSTIGDFYFLQLSRNDLIDYETEASTHFSEISDSVTGLIGSPAWRFRKRYTLSQRAKLSLASIQVHLVEFESMLTSFARLRKKLLADIKQHSIFRHVYEYFDDMAEPDVEIPVNLKGALDFFEGEFQLYRNVRSLLFASLMGGVVGALLTGLIAIATAKR